MRSLVGVHDRIRVNSHDKFINIFNVPQAKHERMAIYMTLHCLSLVVI